MTLLEQILWGSSVLGICLLAHVGLVASSLKWIPQTNNFFSKRFRRVRVSAVLLVTLGILVTAHTLQVWFWALAFVWMNVIPEFSEATYFSLVTYTTVGYGDITLPEGVRIFGTFASVTGMLAFGISTAVLGGLIVRLLPGIYENKL